MDRITIPSEKGPLQLRKSGRLVGLKLIESRDALASPEYIQEELHTNIGGFKLVALDPGELNDVNSKLDAVREQPEVEVGTHVYFPEGSDRPLIATGEIFIEFEEGTSEEEHNICLDECKLTLVERRGPYFLVARVTPQSPNPLKAAKILQDTSLVRLAEPDIDTILDHYSAIPTDTLFNHLWHLQNNGSVPDAAAPLRRGIDAKVLGAWRRLGSLGNANVTIAVIDNGFDLSHPDLSAKIVRPYDLWTKSNQLMQGDPRYTHGTPCASVALASSNGVGIVGAAPNARFMPVSGTSFAARATEEMFDYCIANGADIISCSWGTVDPAYQLNAIKAQAISRAARQGRRGLGAIVLFAAGNEGRNYLNFYAAHPEVIAVGACTSTGNHAFYSNQGRELTVVAPSNGDWPILAARAWWDQGDPNPQVQGVFKFYIDGVSRGNQYKHFGGTSSATPLVAGICALMLSVNPNLTAAEVKQILMQTADKIGNPADYINGHSVKFGAGLVNAERAVAEAARRANSFAAPNNPVTSTGTGTAVNQPHPTPPTSTSAGINGLPNLPTNGWGVQVGVFANPASVSNLASQISRQFAQPVFAGSVIANGQPAYRVVVGHYATQNEAQIMQSRLAAAGFNGLVKNLGGVA